MKKEKKRSEKFEKLGNEPQYNPVKIIDSLQNENIFATLSSSPRIDGDFSILDFKVVCLP